MKLKFLLIIFTLLVIVASFYIYFKSIEPSNYYSITTKPNSISKHLMMHKWDEITFIEHMVPHHEEAISQSNTMLSKVSSQRYKDLLQNIISVQTKEVENMKTWYKIWSGNEYSDKGVYEPMMVGLENYSGKILEREWLQSMIYHHQAAIYMSVSGLQTIHKEDLRTLMESIKTSQTAQILDMEELIDINRAVNAGQNSP